MRSSINILALLLITVVGIVLGLSVGSVHISLDDIFSLLSVGKSGELEELIILQLRFPRVLLCLLVGGGLGLGGYLMQAMVNNPLADPFILGTASGASLGVNLVYLGFIPLSTVSLFPASVAAFAGAIIVTLIAVGVAYEKGRINPSRLLLAGVALSSLMVAVTSLLIFVSASDDKLKKVIFWSMGSFELAGWGKMPLITVSLLILTILFTLLTPHLNILLLGESRAGNLGVNVVVLRWVILGGAALITALSVAVAGPVGFVGLMVPHFVRGVFGVNGKLNILYTILVGGIFLLFCDIVSRWVFPEAALPIGIITSFLGIPFFVYLLTKRNYRFS